MAKQNGQSEADSMENAAIEQKIKAILRSSILEAGKDKVDGEVDIDPETGRKDSEEDEPEEETPYAHRDHAWFVAFAPYERPEIAVSIIIEHGGHGGETAAPIARKILETYFTYYPPFYRTEPRRNKIKLGFN